MNAVKIASNFYGVYARRRMNLNSEFTRPIAILALYQGSRSPGGRTSRPSDVQGERVGLHRQADNREHARSGQRPELGTRAGAESGRAGYDFTPDALPRSFRPRVPARPAALAFPDVTDGRSRHGAESTGLHGTDVVGNQPILRAPRRARGCRRPSGIMVGS